MDTLLYCRGCGTGYAIVGTIPVVCPACLHVTTWTTSPLGPWTFKLDREDKKFLKSIHVSTDS